MINPSTVDRLRHANPEWRPWLSVVDEILRQSSSKRWDLHVPLDLPASDAELADAGKPLLGDQPLPVPVAPIRELLFDLIQTAISGGTRQMQTLRGVLSSPLDAMAVFRSAVRQDVASLQQSAQACGVDSEAFQAVAAVLPMPWLHAYRRRWTAKIPAAWIRGYCPICGAWPGFAEVRGIERSRYFRCGRCGAEWYARALWCPYCATADHGALATHVPQNGAGNAVIEACQRCRGYVKTFTRLQGCSAELVLVEDLATVSFDIAATQLGYQRPAGPGFSLRSRINDSDGATWSVA